MSSPSLLRKPAKMKSVAPVTVAQLSLPGCARAIATTSPSVLALSEGGTASEISVELTRATGPRSRGSYGSFSCR